MDDLVRFAEMPRCYGPLIDCAILHYQFEAIHPFEDGNGRIGRLLIPLFLLAQKALDRPILYLSSYFEEQRETYLSLLKQVSTHGAWEGWISFFLEAVRNQADDSRKRIERVLHLHEQYRDLAQTVGSKAAIRAIDFVMERVYVTVSEIAQYTHTTAPTAKAALDALVSLGVLAPHGRVGGRHVWVADRLLREVYER